MTTKPCPKTVQTQTGLRWTIGQGIGSWQACHRSEPSTTEEPPSKNSPSIETEHSDVNKRRVISKFADKSRVKAVYGTENFKRDTLIVCVLRLAS
ncbi:hypothetical protein TNCV_2958121 [Trichonephila clavipes]|nr:hypothetical protein TNCV_2958121 [Trichonephila clavipes]